MDVLPTCKSVQYTHTHDCCQGKPEEDRSSRAASMVVTPCGCWESNWGPLEVQPLLLITEPHNVICNGG